MATNQPSSIRAQTVRLLADEDERYAARNISYGDSRFDSSSSDSEVVSSPEELSFSSNNSSLDSSSKKSKDFFLEDEESEDQESEDQESEDQESEGQESEDQESEGQESEDQESKFDEDNPLRRGRDENTGIQIISDMNLRSEIEKGNCVRSQLKLWENFLEMRIKLQKCLVTSNKMPQHDVYDTFITDPESKNSKAEAVSKLSGVLEKLLQLQNNLLKNYPETKNILSKGTKRKAEEEANQSDDDSMNEEIPSDSEDEEKEIDNSEQDDSSDNDSEDDSKQSSKIMKLSDFEKILAHNHEAYFQYRDSVIQKWNDKTRISTGNVNKGSQNQSVIKQIEFILNNKEKLLKKTQLKRSEYNTLGKDVTSEINEDGRHVQEYDPEIFDDDDFYHQLLRELIEYKSSDITDPIQLSKQWIQLQSMRNKMKRKIDTRATKGRRIRYGVHQKLVNFMAPITVFDSWTDNAKNNLYSTLFGKMLSASERKIEES